MKRTGSIGLSQNSIRNLMCFYEVIEEFEAFKNTTIYLNAIDHEPIWFLVVDNSINFEPAGLCQRSKAHPGA